MFQDILPLIGSFLSVPFNVRDSDSKTYCMVTALSQIVVKYELCRDQCSLTGITCTHKDDQQSGRFNTSVTMVKTYA